MNLPSIKTLESAFPGKGKTLRTLLESDAAVRAHPVAVSLVARCYNKPSFAYQRLEALNAEAETFGVEHVQQGKNKRSPGFQYLNTGDTYTATLIRLDSGRYIVSCWGDIVERGSYD